MFDWLFGRPKPPAEPAAVDRVWIDLAARDAALVREARTGPPLLILAFFDDTVARVSAAIAAAGLATPPAVLRADRPLPPVEAVHVAERHPLSAVNRALLERLAHERPGVVPVFHTALDDALMRRHGGDRTAGVMKQLGLEAHEAVEHPLVTKALAQAREKLATKVDSAAELDAHAPSMELWMQRHVR